MMLELLTTIPVLPPASPLPQHNQETAIVEQLKPEIVTHIVAKGENLTKIAANYNVPIEKLWAKNTHLAHQDKLEVGTKLEIPTESENTPVRAFVLPVVVKSLSNVPKTVYSGNTYQRYQCVWWVKQWKPEVPNTWSNANLWDDRARADGWTVSNTPVVGAVAQTDRGSYGHVALVIGVSGDTITIREGNFDYKGSVRTRTANASEFRYIY